MGIVLSKTSYLPGRLISWISVLPSLRRAISRKPEEKPKSTCDPQQDATIILQYLAQDYNPEHGFGAVGSSIYDTAWVSMVEKPGTDGEKFWAFQECFEFLLQAQCDDGGWDADAVLFDRIAYTLAGVLALKKHLNREKNQTTRQDWEKRISKASRFLNKTLPGLPAAVAYELPIGAELWLPKMLELVAEEHIHLDSSSVLAWILPCRDKKLSKFPLETLYEQGSISVAHSLEAFIGNADFNRVSQLKTCGSMMGSASATAAYLIYSETWDAEAEAFIRRAIDSSYACHNGGVPSTYPTTIFEQSWIPVNFLKNKVPLSKETEPILQNIGIKLQNVLGAQNGVVGFAQGMCMDADDTAKVLVFLRLLGLPAGPDALIDKFESRDHFLTFGIERNPSVSTNAHVLNALLHMENKDRYISQINKCVQFLCRVWWETNGLVQDKWNISPYYPILLICEGLVEYMHQWETGVFNASGTTSLSFRVSLVVHQALTRLLQTQNSDGSWGPRSSLEETSYAVLTIKCLLSLPFDSGVRDIALHILQKAESYLQYQYSCGYVSTRERLWIDKTLYSIETVSRSYVISALLAPVPKIESSEALSNFFQAPESMVQKQKVFLRGLPSFSQIPEWIVESSIREGYLLIDELRKLNFFSQRANLSDKYLIYCSSCFMMSNNRDLYFLSTDYLMMVLRVTVATYQLDTFMDHQVMAFSAVEIDELERFICAELQNTEYLSEEHEQQNLSTNCKDGPHARVEDAKLQLHSFICFMLAEPTNTAGSYDRMNLRNELRVALLSQVSHVRYSQNLDRNTLNNQPNNATFFSWLRGHGSDNVLYPVILKYMIYHMGDGDGKQEYDVFQTPEAKYLVEDFCRHAAAEVRLWNDYGSAERDRAEGVLNSIDLLESSSPFFPMNGVVSGTSERQNKIETLGKLAQYENRHVQLCLETLEHALKASDAPRGSLLMSRLRMHELVTQVWAEMYSLRQFSATGLQS